ncbi:MAG: hypothetical protein [Microviridae sp.]|nr:MAG: hypothetical protein [Microviridae sp.]
MGRSMLRPMLSPGLLMRRHLMLVRRFAFLPVSMLSHSLARAGFLATDFRRVLSETSGFERGTSRRFGGFSGFSGRPATRFFVERCSRKTAFRVVFILAALLHLVVANGRKGVANVRQSVVNFGVSGAGISPDRCELPQVLVVQVA